MLKQVRHSILNKYLIELAVSSLDSAIRIWDLENSNKVFEFQCEQSFQNILMNFLVENYKLAYLDDHTLCTAGEAGKVTFFDLVDGKELQQFSLENSFASSISAVQDMIAVGTESGSLHVAEDVFEKHKLHHIPKLHKRMIRTINFTQGSTSVLTGSDDGEIKLVDLHKMKTIKTFQGHTSNINCIDIHPFDSKQFISCSYDQTIRLWDSSSNQCVEQFKPFETVNDNLWGVKFNFDGSLFGVCTQSGQLSFYQRN